MISGLPTRSAPPGTQVSCLASAFVLPLVVSLIVRAALVVDVVASCVVGVALGVVVDIVYCLVARVAVIGHVGCCQHHHREPPPRCPCQCRRRSRCRVHCFRLSCRKCRPLPRIKIVVLILKVRIQAWPLMRSTAGNRRQGHVAIRVVASVVVDDAVIFGTSLCCFCRRDRRVHRCHGFFA